jgi:L-asparaginase/Glu-tRNA(Gln) amidotransferase subunit D
VTSSKAAELAMKRRVCVFTTGGTIATRVDEYGIARLGTSTIENLLAHADAEVEIEMKSLMDKESANLIPSDWKVLAKESARIIVRGEVDGIVILHGTDTMHYTAAALSFMVQNPGIPIVLTGSMVPGSDPKSDAISNFQAALQIASESSIAEVCIVFSSNPGGRKKVVLRGCRARKVRSFRKREPPPSRLCSKEKDQLYRRQPRKKGILQDEFECCFGRERCLCEAESCPDV